MLFQGLSRRALGAVAVASAFVLAGCGDSSDGAKAPTQVAAKVNAEELSVHQINAVLAQTPNLKPEQVDLAASRVLERLIDQELLVQRAIEKKLDRDPQIMQAIEAARREVLSRAYMERHTAAAEAPSAEAVQAFFNDNPALFAQRRIYTLQELNVPVAAEQVEALRAAVSEAKNLNDIVNWLRDQNIAFQAGGGVRAAEQLPLEALPRFAAMQDGQIGLVQTPNGVLIIYLAGSRPAPLDLEKAKPFIERFMQNRSKTEMARSELKRLRDVAQIEYMGKFSAPAPSAVAEPAPAPADAAPAAPISAEALEKGVTGLK